MVNSLFSVTVLLIVMGILTILAATANLISMVKCLRKEQELQKQLEEVRVRESTEDYK